MAVVLDYLPAKRPIVITNVHLTWDPIFKDVKVIQAMMLVSELDNIIKQHNQDPKRCVLAISAQQSKVY